MTAVGNHRCTPIPTGNSHIFLPALRDLVHALNTRVPFFASMASSIAPLISEDMRQYLIRAVTRAPYESLTLFPLLWHRPSKGRPENLTEFTLVGAKFMTLYLYSSFINTSIPKIFGPLLYQSFENVVNLIAKYRFSRERSQRRIPYDLRFLLCYWLFLFEWNGRVYADIIILFGLLTALSFLISLLKGYMKFYITPMAMVMTHGNGLGQWQLTWPMTIVFTHNHLNCLLHHNVAICECLSVPFCLHRLI